MLKELSLPLACTDEAWCVEASPAILSAIGVADQAGNLLPTEKVNQDDSDQKYKSGMGSRWKVGNSGHAQRIIDMPGFEVVRE
jgi:hypothetical protein